ncbi:Amino acid transporter, transmembrane domain [Phytophthora cactorum]|nr:Amino acid transporter, transmembrane domain [Phytophthora cactorum]
MAVSDETSPLLPLAPEHLSSCQRHRHRRESFETGFPLVIAEEIDVQTTVSEAETEPPRAAVSVSPCQWLGRNCAVPFTLLMSAIGAGTLAVPYTFVLLSPVQAVLVLCCVGLAMAFTADTLVDVHVAVATESADELQESRETYQHLAWRAGGKPLARLTGALTAFAVFGACVGCVRVVKDMAPVMLSAAINGFEQWRLEEQQYAVVITVWVVVLVIVLPLGCLTKISALRFSSYFGAAFSVYLVGAVTYRAVVGGMDDGASLFWRISEVVGIYNFTFMLHLNVIPLLAQLVAAETEGRREIHDKDVEALVIRKLLSLCICCKLLDGPCDVTWLWLSAHLWSKTQGNILLNLSNDRIMAVPRVAILLTILLSFPLLFHPLRSLVLAMYVACTSRSDKEEENDSAPSQFVQAVMTVLLLVAQIICALRVPGLQYLADALLLVSIGFLRASHHVAFKSQEMSRLVLLSAMGVVATVFCVAATLQLILPA